MDDRNPSVRVVENLNESGQVHVLGWETTPDHIVRIRHYLNAGPTQVGMKVSGGQIDCFMRGEGEVIAHQRNDYTGIAWMRVRQRRRPAVGVYEFGVVCSYVSRGRRGDRLDKPHHSIA